MSQITRYGDGGGPGAAIETLTGNTGGPVGPDGAFNINVVGADGVVVTGNAGTNTLTITQSGDAFTIGTAQTVGAVTADIFTLTLGVNNAATVQATITGAASDYSAALVGRTCGGARRAGAGAILVGSPISDFSEDSAGSPLIDIVVSGNNIVVQVTGVGAQTWNWRAQIHYVLLTV